MSVRFQGKDNNGHCVLELESGDQGQTPSIYISDHECLVLSPSDAAAYGADILVYMQVPFFFSAGLTAAQGAEP